MPEVTRPLSDTETKGKDARIHQFLSTVHPAVGRDYVWKYQARDLSTINWIYAEGLDDQYDPGLMWEGYSLLLGEVLVRQHGFEWRLHPDAGLQVVDPRTSQSIVLCELEQRYVPGDVDEREEVPYDYGDVIMNAYEVILAEMKRLRHNQ